MIQRLLSAVIGVLFVIAVFIFTSFLVALALAVGLLAFGWLWWRSRRERGRTIEGEYRIIESK